MASQESDNMPYPKSFQNRGRTRLFFPEALSVPYLASSWEEVIEYIEEVVEGKAKFRQLIFHPVLTTARFNSLLPLFDSDVPRNVSSMRGTLCEWN